MNNKDTIEAPERIYLPADTDDDTWNVLAKNPSRNWKTGEPANNIEYARVGPPAAPTANYRLDIDHQIYEDDLPKDITKTLYDQWFAKSRIIDGVRMGPSVKTVAPATSKQACLKCGHDQTYFTGLCAAYIAGHETPEGTEMVMCGCKCVFVAPPAPDEANKALAHELTLSGDSRYFDPSLADKIAAALAQARKEAAESAATQMRTACVEKVEALRDRQSKDSNDPFINGIIGACNKLIADLKSITLDQVKQK